MLKRRAHRHRGDADLNITAFLNLMVILIPFLLITAVFSRITIVQLDIPSANNNAPPPQPPEQVDLSKQIRVEIIVYPDRIFISDGRQVLFTVTQTDKGDLDFATLSSKLQLFKAKLQKMEIDRQDATILVDSKVTYDTVVSVMDAVRLQEIPDKDQNKLEQFALFPDISLGDAPPLGTAPNETPNSQ